MLAARHPPGAKTVVSAFQEAAGPAREGLRLALCYGPVEHTEADLRAVVAQAPPPVAAAAAEVLAFHGRLTDPGGRPLLFADDPDPAVRAVAWRITTLLAGSGLARPPLLERSADVKRAVADADANVRARAFEAAQYFVRPLDSRVKRILEAA
jgi:hypothetical protein